MVTTIQAVSNVVPRGWGWWVGLTSRISLLLVLFDLDGQITLWHLDVVLGGTVGSQKMKESAVLVQLYSQSALQSPLTGGHGSSYEVEFVSGDVRNVHVVGGWAQLLKLLAGEDINRDKMDLCVTVLASLGGAHLDNLTWSSFDDNMSVTYLQLVWPPSAVLCDNQKKNEPVLAESRTLHGESRRCPGRGLLKGVIVLDIAMSVLASSKRRGLCFSNWTPPLCSVNPP